MQKHAFLIIAHNNFLVLERLIESLKSPRADIFLHVDSKVKTLPAFLKETEVIVLNNRVDTRWGDVSQIETEFALFKEAFDRGGYSHYHVISGTHFPLLPINTILDYCDGNQGKTIFCGLCKASKKQEYWKLRLFNFFTRYLSDSNSFVKTSAQKLRRATLQVQEFFGVERNKGVNFYKASNWASFTEEAVGYLLGHNSYIMKLFNKTFCGDEFFAPTLLMASPLKGKIVNYNQYLKVDMGDANPRYLTNEDFDMVMESGCMFARKFSDENIEVVDRILRQILQ